MIVAQTVQPKEKKKRKTPSHAERVKRATKKSRTLNTVVFAPDSPRTIMRDLEYMEIVRRRDIRRDLELEDALKKVDTSDAVSAKAGVDAANDAFWASIRSARSEDSAGMDGPILVLNMFYTICVIGCCTMC